MTAISPVQSVTAFRFTRNSETFGWFSSRKQLPAPHRLVIYQTTGAQNIGYLDARQQWHRADGSLESDSVISWTAVRRG